MRMKNMKNQKIKVLVSDSQKKINIKIKDIRDIATQMLLSVYAKSSELSITIVTDKQIKELNLRYRGKNYPTDVLAFPQDIGNLPTPFVKGGIYKVVVLGDIVISAETALKQALQNEQDFMGEMKLLLSHGILHLLGYDHIKEKDNKIMRRMEKKLCLNLK